MKISSRQELALNHIPVMSSEVLSYLEVQSDGVYLDGTIGPGGHATQILKSLKKPGKLIGLDRDEEILIEPVNHFQLMIESFSDEIIKPNLDKFNFEVDLLNQAKVMEACRVSNNEKRYVEIKEIK